MITSWIEFLCVLHTYFIKWEFMPFCLHVLSLKLLSRFKWSLVVGMGLCYKLMTEFNCNLYWSIIVPTLHEVKLYLDQFSKILLIIQKIGTWQNMLLIRIYNIHLKHFLIWQIFNEVQEQISDCAMLVYVVSVIEFICNKWISNTVRNSE